MADQPKCPKCGAKGGYYSRRRVTLRVDFGFDGTPDDSSIERDRNDTGRLYRCSTCDANITKYINALLSAA